jgi:hypothetical protein
MMTSIRATKLSSSCMSPQTVDGIGSRLWLSSVAPVVVSSTNESPGRVSVVLPSTETSDMQSNYSPRAAKRSWLSRAHTIGDEQLPWPMSYNSFSVLILYETSDTPNPVATWCSNWAQSTPNIRTEFLEYPIRRNAAREMSPLRHCRTRSHLSSFVSIVAPLITCSELG